MLFASIQSYAQTDSTHEETFEMFAVTEPAHYNAGFDSLMRFLAYNINYPQIAIENDVQGTVLLSFVVTNEGEIRDVQVESEKLGYGLEEEAIRVLKRTSGQWTPAQQRDKMVAMRFRLPIKFALR